MGYLGDIEVPNVYSGQMGTADLHDLDRFFVFSPFLDPPCWGSAFSDDPWPERAPELLLRGVLGRELRAQQEGGVCRFTRRTLFSGSQVAYELHDKRVMIADVRYRPAPHGDIVGAFNARFETTYPLDLPLDVVGALYGFAFVTAGEVAQRIADGPAPGQLAALLRASAAIENDGLAAIELLRRFLDHESVAVRGTIFNIALEYRFEALIDDLAAAETHAELAAAIENLQINGMPMHRFDEHGEPEGLYPDDDEDEDENEDENEDEEENDE